MLHAYPFGPAENRRAVRIPLGRVFNLSRKRYDTFYKVTVFYQYLGGNSTSH